MSPLVADLISALERGEPATDLVREGVTDILSGTMTPETSAAFLTALNMEGGDRTEHLVAAACVLRERMTVVAHGLPMAFDTCGTGGDGQGTVNISTVAAIVVASCGIAVAKHGNRSVSSRSGSADVLEALGLRIEAPVERHVQLLKTIGITFLYAPAFHPALRHAASVRKKLGFRTIFNALGPLLNPAKTTHQLLGVYSDGLVESAADALLQLGVTRAWVVRGEDGLDEVSPCARSKIVEVVNGKKRSFTVTPSDFGLKFTSLHSIAGGDAAFNAHVLRTVLSGVEHSARNATLLNAAAAIAVATGDSYPECVVRARQAIDSGAARSLLARWTAETLR